MTQKTPTALSVNLNKIALLRNSREGSYPDVVAHARTCIAAGADGITIHPRPDQRHIRVGDVVDLHQMLQSEATIEFNIEGNPFAGAMGSYPGFMELVEQNIPEQCTLVPDSNDQLTSDHGFDLTQSGDRLLPIIEKLQSLGCRISLFMDPDIEQIKLAKDIGADRIELYTGPYAEAYKNQSPELEGIFQSYYEAAVAAQEIGLGLNAGHDLNLDNLPKFREIPNLLEVSIGHALTVDSIAMGMSTAVARYKNICIS
ncbi:MAG: pyridoxine 5'-phosphate synthase [Candidatus Pelagadaptatus aseana]|uniref:pyridoxine 5'-phosphate synthase n=1 Tax=Candidatus Pelagadaptatus aseana TaxID=3120508 RepID=UPI0039B26A1D